MAGLLADVAARFESRRMSRLVVSKKRSVAGSSDHSDTCTELVSHPHHCLLPGVAGEVLDQCDRPDATLLPGVVAELLAGDGDGAVWVLSHERGARRNIRVFTNGSRNDAG